MYRKRNLFQRRSKNSRGFTLLELVMSVAVLVILTSAAVPIVKTSLANYRINNSVSMLTSAINSTRYRAIYNGYQYNAAFTKANGSQVTAQYQLGAMVPPSGSFANVGTAIPFTTSDIELENNVTMVFSPSGKVTASSGSLNGIKLTYKRGLAESQTRTITVSAYGNITVTNP